MLLHGIRGCGKSLFALRLTQHWLCKTRSACGECRDCHAVASGMHPDALLVEREESKATISIEQVRAIAEWEPLGSTSSSGKVLRILDLDLMQEPAQNALLKMIEEPSQGVLFILTASRLGGILPTLLSRCHLLRLQPLADQELTVIASRQGWTLKDPSALALSAGSAGILRFLADVDVGSFVRHVLGHLAISSAQDCADIAVGLREFRAKHPAEGDLASDAGFVEWMLDILVLMLDEGLRLRAGLPLRRLPSYKEEVDSLSRRMTYAHMESATLSLVRAKADIALHVDPWAVLEEALRRILVERYVQTP